MRIALVSPLFESVPPKLYGGTERVVANLCRGLGALGHDITLFASGDSQVACELASTVGTALRLAPIKVSDPAGFHLAQLAAVLRRADEFDAIHNHMDYFGFPLAMSMRNQAVANVTTLHGRLDHPETVHVLRSFSGVPLVSISNAQRLPAPSLNWVKTVYHGLPLDEFTVTKEPGKYLAFLGRISFEKRPDLAIEIARKSGVPLKIAAKVDTADKDYYETKIKKLIDGNFIEFIGEIGEHEKSEFLGGALGLVFPIDWPEPFGLAPVEAWACGTPVVARPCGSVPELHVDGLTGFVNADVNELARRVEDLPNLNRAAIRAYAERRFSLQRMCEDYIDVYRRLRGVSKAKTLQPGKSHGGEWRFLHPVRGVTAGYQQDHP